MKTSIEIRQLIINEFMNGYYLKRTSKGLSDNIDISIDIVEKVLGEFPKIFVKTTGCKGEMWVLSDIWW